MTNEEKAKEISNKYEDWWALESPDVEKAVSDSVMEMARWKEEQFKSEKQALIDRACEWLMEIENRTTITNINDFVKGFRKAMEEG